MTTKNKTDISRTISSNVGRFNIVTKWNNDIFDSAILTNDHVDGQGGEVITLYVRSDLDDLIKTLKDVDTEMCKSGYAFVAAAEEKVK